MTDFRDKEGYFVAALTELEAEGLKGSTLSQIALRATTYDEDYLRKRQRLNRVLRWRSDVPDRVTLMGAYGATEAEGTLGRLEEAGVVGFELEHPLEAHETPERLYSLMPEVAEALGSLAVPENTVRHTPGPIVM